MKMLFGVVPVGPKNPLKRAFQEEKIGVSGFRGILDPSGSRPDPSFQCSKLRSVSKYIKVVG